MDIRIGDRWEFRSNNAVLVRTITAIGTKRVAYTDAYGLKGDCSIETFKRWWKGATLEYATDWNGRDVSYRIAPTGFYIAFQPARQEK